MSTQIGEMILKYRKMRNLKQKELADIAGINRMSIGNYERGTRIPNAEILQKIAEALGVTINDLVDPTTESTDLLVEILKEDEKKKEQTKERGDLIIEEINKRLSILNKRGKLEGLKRIDDLRFRVEYRKDEGFSTGLPNDDTFDNWLLKLDSIEKE